MVSNADESTHDAVLDGCFGWVNGERFVLKDGESLTIGRSRSCDVSLRRIQAYLDRSPSVRDEDHDFNTVSREHLRLSLNNGELTIQDLSTNGTYCNNETVERSMSCNLNQADIELRLGTRESFRIALCSPDEPHNTSSLGQAPAEESAPSLSPEQ